MKCPLAAVVLCNNQANEFLPHQKSVMHTSFRTFEFSIIANFHESHENKFIPSFGIELWSQANQQQHTQSLLKRTKKHQASSQLVVVLSYES